MMYRNLGFGALILIDVANALNNGLALKPQMGWNTWNTFGCNINQATILSAAQAIKNSGLINSGYQYVVIDDCWSVKSGRDSSGNLVADPSKFPNGMKWLADQVHALGLKIGIYSSAGTLTCAGYPASLGREQQDANLWASWGIDYLKYDNCNDGGQSSQQGNINRYTAMRDALAKAGRPILYSMCNWGTADVWNWAAPIGNSWRMSGDITANFDAANNGCPATTSGGYACSIMNILNKAAPISTKGSTGGWNDLDMMVVGFNSLSSDEQKLHFTMWSAIKSPLIMGHDVTKQSSDTFAILTNKNILDLSQGVWGVATRTYVRSNIQLWQQTSPDNVDRVVIVLNSGGSDQTLTVPFSDIFANDSGRQSATYTVTELWTNTITNSVKVQISITVKKHGVWVGRFHPSSGSQSTSSSTTTTRIVTTGATTIGTTTKTTSAQSGAQTMWGQCGGIGWTGPTTCQGSTCQYSNPYYSQCL
ncbi:hypothetical protein H072_5097 [Dactylellina haptotyla CBS 200.50]|uniref:Alpha-galactosidase n=1 Tax=Dactylellina haptotyla (strain CBS 200.50) TaxID=1284197 RepID=S8ADI6_DACHA|nr:hypothetical protein H072_5097 [Dactylellina haptotyla CBS 200.50]